MGVIRNRNSTLNDNDSDLIEDILDNLLDNNDIELERDVEVRGVRRHRESRNRLRTNRLRPEPTFRALGLRGKSHKKNRRYADSNLLSQQFESLSDGEELDDISIYDFIPQTVSAFAQLLINNENMKTWNDIINCTEDQQNQLLGSSANHKRTRAQSERKATDNDIDGRSAQTASTADQCFKRLDSDLKNTLRKKHIPLGVLASIEEEITDFFSEQPFATYKSCLQGGYRRLLLHACCQYLDLKCLSFDANGERWSRVNNRNKYFSQPSIPLTEYLENRYSSNS